MTQSKARGPQSWTVQNVHSYARAATRFGKIPFFRTNYYGLPQSRIQVLDQIEGAELNSTHSGRRLDKVHGPALAVMLLSSSRDCKVGFCVNNDSVIQNTRSNSE